MVGAVSYGRGFGGVRHRGEASLAIGLVRRCDNLASVGQSKPLTVGQLYGHLARQARSRPPQVCALGMGKEGVPPGWACTLCVMVRLEGRISGFGCGPRVGDQIALGGSTCLPAQVYHAGPANHWLPQFSLVASQPVCSPPAGSWLLPGLPACGP